MSEWIERYTGMTIAEASLALTVLGMVVGALAVLWTKRAALRRVKDRFDLVTGRTRRRYTRSFLDTFGVLRNLYSEYDERLDLRETYVPLSFALPTLDDAKGVRATDVLADQNGRRVVILGNAGTGKSTLLRAFGSGVLRPVRERGSSDLKTVAPGREVPLLISLREFAYEAAGPRSLSRYLVDAVLPGRGVRGGRAFLRRLLAQNCCLVMLDGLDEVPPEHYQHVRKAIFDFADEPDEAFPTASARIVLTCREQYYLARADDWAPLFPTAHTYTLAPLRDAEISRYLGKRITPAHAPRTARALYDSIKASGTMELHRVPLVLAISSGMYLRVVGYEIPHSLAEFYQVMIRHLLRRRDSPSADASVSRFDAKIKEQFLRGFAYEMAIRPGEFGVFTQAEAVAHARWLAETLGEFPVDQAWALVCEVRDNAGLIQSPPAGRLASADDPRYLFAHRSIQEYLVAAQVQKHGEEGTAFLLERATDESWRQVILFYASLEHEYSVALISGLAERNSELAGHCLAVTAVPIETGVRILDRLQEAVQSGQSIELNLRALTAATRSTQRPIADGAAARIRDALANDEVATELRRLLAQDVEQVLRVLIALAESNSVHIISLVPRLLDLIPPEDLRLVAPLWHCLGTPGLERYEDAIDALVRTLLVIAMSEEGLAELESQPQQRPRPLADPAVVARAYPFDDGVDRASNLVTLLAWAQQKDVVLEKPNRFLGARDAGQLNTIERDRGRWRSISVVPHRPLRWFFIIGFLTALVGAGILCIEDWGDVLWPRGWWSLALLPAPAMLSFLLAGLMAAVGPLRLSNNDASNPVVVELDAGGGIASDGTLFWDRDTLLLALKTISLCATYVLALTPLIGWSIVGFISIGTAVIWLLFWLPATAIFEPGNRLYLGRPNPYVDAYEDPRSRHWITRAS